MSAPNDGHWPPDPRMVYQYGWAPGYALPPPPQGGIAGPSPPTASPPPPPSQQQQPQHQQHQHQVSLQPHHWRPPPSHLHQQIPSYPTAPGPHPPPHPPQPPSAYYHYQQQYPHQMMYYPNQQQQQLLQYHQTQTMQQQQHQRGGRGRGRGTAFNQQPPHPNNNGNNKRPSLSIPPLNKRQRKKDIVPPLEPVTQEPVVRPPMNDAEKAEIEAWKADRRKNWPSTENVVRKEQDAAARRERGELEKEEGGGGGGGSRSIRIQNGLRDILQKQREMGLMKQAGTEGMLDTLGSNRTEGQRHQSYGRGGGRRGRGRGRRGGPVHGHNSDRGEEREEKEKEEATNGLLESLQGYGSDGDHGDTVEKQTVDTAIENKKHEPRHRHQRPPPPPPRHHHHHHRQQPPQSLLEKLLQKEIRQDMSYILQSFRFFIMNDFFRHVAPGQPLDFPPSTEEEAEVHPAWKDSTSNIITNNTRGGGAGGEGEKPRTQNLIQEILAKKEGVDVTDTDTSSLQGGGAKEVTTASDDDGSSGDDEVSTSSSEDEEAKKKRNE